MERKYEVLLLLNPIMEKTELAKLIKEIESKLGGKIVKKEEWGIKPLAYKIQKLQEAFYVLYYVETTSENVHALKEMIGVESNIIRPMILRHEKAWPFDIKTSKDLKFPERKPRTPRTPRVEETVEEKQSSKEGDK